MSEEELDNSPKVESFPEPSSKPINATSSKNNFLIIGIIALFLILLIILLIYLFSSNSNTDSSSSTSQRTTGLFGKQSAYLNPQQVFLEYRSEMQKTKTLEDLYQVSLKYGDKESVKKYQADKEKMDTSSIITKQAVYEMIINLIPKISEIDMANIKEEKNSTSSTLTLNTKDGKSSGTVSMIKEDNAWKISKESWKYSGNFANKN